MAGVRAVLKWGGVLGVGGLVLTGALAIRDTRAAVADVERLRAEVMRLKQSARTPQIAVREDRSARGVNAPSLENTSPIVAAARTPESTEEVTTAEGEYRAQVFHEETVKLYQKRHTEEPADVEWGRRAADDIRSIFSDAEFADIEISADCRSTLCRVNFSYSDPGIGRAAVEKFENARLWPGQRFTIHETELKTFASYVAREGFPLPALDPESIAY